MKFISPSIDLGAFNCPNCGAYAQMDQMVWRPTSIHHFNSATCIACRGITLWKLSVNGSVQELIYPTNATASLPHDDMPEDVKQDYLEARDITNRSPRAAAALLRLALEKLLSHLRSKKGGINEAIGDLVQQGKISGDVTRVADVLRIIGNDSVHPGKMDDGDRAEITSKLFEFLNFFVYETITRPKEIESMYSMLPEGALKGVEKRDGK